MRLRVCDGLPHQVGKRKGIEQMVYIGAACSRTVCVRVYVCVWLVGIINYMRVIGTINGSVSKTGCTTYAHCPLPVGGIERDRRHNLVAILSPRVKNLFHFNERYWETICVMNIYDLGSENSLRNIFITIKTR